MASYLPFMGVGRTWRAGAVGVVLLLSASRAPALVLDDPVNFAVTNTWSGASLGIPAPLGGLLFSADGATLYVVGASEASDSALYAVPVTRDASRHVVDLGPASAVQKVFDGTASGLDAGWEHGPSGTLFYTYWSANVLGERPGGITGTETAFDMAEAGVPNSIAGLTFSPHLIDPGTGAGQMQISVWGDARELYDVALTPEPGGLFSPAGVTLFVHLPQEGTGAIQYVPSGPFAGHMMYVNWDYGEVRILSIDPGTGLPIDRVSNQPTRGTADPIDTRFAHDLGVGPWGLEFDPLSNDFFLGTWKGAPEDTIIQIAGAGFPPPTEICGNCRDDDGNGLMDFEDPACCGGSPAAMQLKRAALTRRPKGGGTRLMLKAFPAPMDLGQPPVAHDVVVQVRADGSADGYCSVIPAASVKASKRGLRFRDRKGTVPTARGLEAMALRLKRNGRVLATASGRRAAIPSIASGTPLRMSWAVRDAGASEGQCSSVVATMRTTRKGGLRFP